MIPATAIPTFSSLLIVVSLTVPLVALAVRAGLAGYLLTRRAPVVARPVAPAGAGDGPA